MAEESYNEMRHPVSMQKKVMILMRLSKIRRRTMAGSFVAMLLAGILIAGPAQASISDAVGDGSSPQVIHEETVGDSLNFDSIDPVAAEFAPTPEGGVEMRAAGFTVRCVPTVNSPHISEGARKKGKIYVIFKTKVACTGTGSYPSSVSIKVKSSLMWDKARWATDTKDGVKWEPLLSREETRSVKVNGKDNTFYVPRDGETGGQRTGHYQGVSTVTIVTPAGQKVGSDISKPVFCKPTTSTARCVN